MSDLDVEQEIQKKGLNAPRLTPTEIDGVIVSEQYHVFDKTTLTVCVLTLINGFQVTGESACASPENYDKELGEMIARRNAVAKIWALEGYLLTQKLAFPNVPDNIKQIAKLCHNVNKAYCESLGDVSQPDWDYAPEWQRESAKKGVMFHKENPDAGPAASHESWLAEKKAAGWVYGAVKNPDATPPTHPCFTEYENLPKEQQAKDALFIAVVRSFD